MRSLLFLTVFLFGIASFAQEKRTTYVKDQPLPARVVNDFGKFLTKTEKDDLEKELNSFRERKGYSIVIITLTSLTYNKTTQFTIEETAQLYFNKWGIGDNVKNDGVLIMLSKDPRRIRIHTGSGMATLLTDEDCRSIINTAMAPNFKADLYFDGLKDAIKEIENRIVNNESANFVKKNTETPNAVDAQQAVSKEVTAGEGIKGFFQFLYGIIMLVVIGWLFIRYRSRKRASGVYSSGGYSGGGGNVYINNNNYGGRRRSWFNSGGSSSGSSWFSGSGGYSSGSSGSSGGSNSSSSSGSYKSYGGGSSSGGGASGSW